MTTDLLDWRCINPECVVQPMFGRYLPTGGVEVRMTGRQGRPHAYMYDLWKCAVTVHCGACHEWQQLERTQAGEIVAVLGYPGIYVPSGWDCPGCALLAERRRRGEPTAPTGYVRWPGLPSSTFARGGPGPPVAGAGQR